MPNVEHYTRPTGASAGEPVFSGVVGAAPTIKEARELAAELAAEHDEPADKADCYDKEQDHWWGQNMGDTVVHIYVVR